jgi:hypothetical protein
MRKFIALGLGVLTSATFMVGSSVAARADTSSTPTQDALCAESALPAALTGLGTDLTAANTALSAANTALGQKQAALNTATTNLASSLVDYVHALDTSGDVAGTKAIFDVRLSQYAQAFAAASSAGATWYAAQVQVLTVEQGQTLFGGVVEGLCPVS